MTNSAKLRVIAVVCALTVFGALRPDVLAYALLGYKWNVSQVVYYINPRNVYMSDAVTTAAIRKAADAWTSQTTANIELIYGGSTSGGSFTLNHKNEVFFRSDSSAGGSTYWWADSAGNLVDADISFNQAAYQFTADGLGCSGAINIQDIATHEFGHVLGLQHSPQPEATMYPWMPALCDTSWRSLSGDDIAGIEAVYPSAARRSPPSAPSGLSVSLNPLNLTNSLRLAWNDNSNNEAGFKIERSTDGVSFAPIGEVGANTAVYTDLGLLSGSAYQYRVAAFNGDGTSGYSNTASGQTDSGSSAQSGGPRTLSVSAYKVRRQLKADLTWSGFTSATIEIYRNGALRTSTPNDGAHTDSSNVKGGGSYTYKACESGSSVCSDQVTITF